MPLIGTGLYPYRASARLFHQTPAPLWQLPEGEIVSLVVWVPFKFYDPQVNIHKSAGWYPANRLGGIYRRIRTGTIIHPWCYNSDAEVRMENV
jgi:hypothetical protein